MSHWKRNGNGTLAFVQEAMKKCDCNAETFFARAAHVAKVAENGISPLKDAQNFCRVTRGGAISVPGYEVPVYVVRLAKKVHDRPGDPRRYFGSLKT